MVIHIGWEVQHETAGFANLETNEHEVLVAGGYRLRTSSYNNLSKYEPHTEEATAWDRRN